MIAGLKQEGPIDADKECDMVINHTDYSIAYDEAKSIVICQGSFRLHTEQYQSIYDLLVSVADSKPATLTLDVRKLQFLNSSGINTLSKFILLFRKHKASQVVVKGSSQFPWQAKSLKNLQRLLPGLQLEIT